MHVTKVYFIQLVLKIKYVEFEGDIRDSVPPFQILLLLCFLVFHLSIIITLFCRMLPAVCS